MPPTTSILLVLLAALCSFIYLRRAISSWWNPRRNDRQQPPGPRPLPVIGNLHMLGNLPHRSLQKLAKKYGPIMSIRLGNVPTVVVSSPQAAEQFLKTYDTVFASRPKLQFSEVLSYGTKGMAFTEYGPYWRSVRKLCTLELLTVSKIDSYAPMRREELAALVESVKKSAGAREVVDLSNKVSELIEDLTYRMLFKRSKDERFDLKEVVQKIMKLGGAFNLSDFVPWLAPFDLQGLTRSMKEIGRQIDEILEKIIDEHEQERKEHAYQARFKDFTDVLLSLMNKPIISNDEESFTFDRTNIKAILLDMIAAGIESSATVILWSLSQVLRHPRIMKKLQQELEIVVGFSKMVEEGDVAQLVYLDMVLKECLRLHPIAPLLVPHESMEDATVNGYFIPKKSRVIVNVWTIGRDPEVWSDNVEEFYPERFEGSNIDFKGHDFQLIPFGSGRRKCPGMQLGLVTVRLVLAQLLHCFAWELPAGEVDMTEKFGISMPRASNLLAVPTYRLYA